MAKTPESKGPQFDQWFIDEATALGLTPEQYAASLAVAILEEVHRLRSLAERAAAA